MTSLATLLPQRWQSRNWLTWLLWPLSLLFGLLSLLRRLAYFLHLLPTKKLPVPVLIVGNLTVGGTGKTPLVIALVEALARAGFRPGVVARGYGGTLSSTSACTEVKFNSEASAVGDEPLLIARRTAVPVWVGRHRPAVAKALLKAQPLCNVIISDDGLQHYALPRKVEITIFDERLAGNGWLLPAGPLREPLWRKRDANVINLGSSQPNEALMQKATALLKPAPTAMRLSMQQVIYLKSGQKQPLTELTGKAIYACAGIGHPERFFQMLQQRGLTLKQTTALPDHFDFAGFTLPATGIDLILMTEKDAVKCQAIAAIANDARVAYVPIEAQLDPALLALVLRKLNG